MAAGAWGASVSTGFFKKQGIHYYHYRIIYSSGVVRNIIVYSELRNSEKQSFGQMLIDLSYNRTLLLRKDHRRKREGEKTQTSCRWSFHPLFIPSMGEQCSPTYASSIPSILYLFALPAQEAQNAENKLRILNQLILSSLQ